MSALAIVALITGLLVVIPAFWCVVVLALSYASGWQTLAASYAANEPPRGTRFAGQSGSVGAVSYRNCLVVHVAGDGLFLMTPLIFRVGHRPLFIPWNAIRNQKPIKFLWHEAVSFEVGSGRGTEVRLPTRIFEERTASAAAPSVRADAPRSAAQQDVIRRL